MIRIFFKPGKSKRLWISLVLTVILIAGFATGSSESSSQTLPVVVLADIHFNPFYDPGLFPDLVKSPVDLWDEIFESSDIIQPKSWGNETNYPLLLKILGEVRKQASSSPVVLFQGDILAHKFRDTFFNLYGNKDETILRSFVHKTVEFFVYKLRRALHNDAPVVFVLGNNDSYAGDYRLVPKGRFLAETAGLFYEMFLLREPDKSSFIETYSAGGYYKAEFCSSNAVFICLNTIMFSKHWFRNRTGQAGEAPERQLDWFEQSLAEACAVDKKVWLLMHIPPGVDVHGTVRKYMDKRGHISDALMMWKPEYQERFIEITRKYSETIQVCLAGHTHMDEYRIFFHGEDPEAILITPALSPQFGNNPAFKVFRAFSQNWELLDYNSFSYSFGSLDKEFAPLYAFSRDYDLEAALIPSLNLLLQRLKTDETLRESYIRFYYSGNDKLNRINEVNWPAYWCAIGNIDKGAYVGCVNHYR